LLAANVLHCGLTQISYRGGYEGPAKLDLSFHGWDGACVGIGPSHRGG